MWLYFRFSLNLRDVEDLLAERGVIVSHETIRFGAGKFGRQYAKPIRRDRPSVGDKGHLDKLRPYGTAKRDLAPGLEHRS